MINGNTYKVPSQYGSVYSTGTQTPSPSVFSAGAPNGAFSLPQTQTGFAYQSPQFDTTGTTTPDLTTIVQAIAAIVTQLIQTITASGNGGSPATPNPTPAPGTGGSSKAKATPAPTPTPAPDPTPAPAPSSSNAGLSQDQQQFLDLVNKARKDAGLNPVTANAGMMKETTQYSQDIENAGGGLTHTLNGSQFGDRIKQGYQWHSSANENLAQGQNAQDAFNALMNDPPHKANILDPNVTQIGIGHVGNTWTQDMAT